MSEQELGTKQQPEKKQENGKEQEPEKKKVHKFVHLTPKVPKRPHACDRCRKAKVKCEATVEGSPCTRCRSREEPCTHGTDPVPLEEGEASSHIAERAADDSHQALTGTEQSQPGNTQSNDHTQNQRPDPVQGPSAETSGSQVAVASGQTSSQQPPSISTPTMNSTMQLSNTQDDFPIDPRLLEADRESQSKDTDT
ncbi:hypothetical protein RBB50_005115 [Rhinocladiella similis]